MEDITCEGCACEQDKEREKEHIHIALVVFFTAAALGLICGTLSVLLLLWVTK